MINYLAIGFERRQQPSRHKLTEFVNSHKKRRLFQSSFFVGVDGLATALALLAPLNAFPFHSPWGPLQRIHSARS